jgi:hypothetical protein
LARIGRKALKVFALEIVGMVRVVTVRCFVAGATLAVAAAFGSVGSAATVNDLSGGATCTYGLTTGAGVSASIDCSKANPLGKRGNTKLKHMNAQKIFTEKTWTIADKVSKSDTLGEYLTISFDPKRKTGTWSLRDGLTFTAGEVYAIALKGAKSSFVYLLDTSATSGTWSMVDIRNSLGNTAKLSKLTLFGTAALTQIPLFGRAAILPAQLVDTDAPAPVPLPATGLLLIAGLAGLGMMRRRISHS